MLDGRIEAVKLVDGIPRVVGERGLSDLFDEVPVTLGAFFAVGFHQYLKDAETVPSSPRR